MRKWAIFGGIIGLLGLAAWEHREHLRAQTEQGEPAPILSQVLKPNLSKLSISTTGTNLSPNPNVIVDGTPGTLSEEIARFEKFIRDVDRKLPRVDDILSESPEHIAHGSPSGIYEAGDLLAAVAEKVSARPEFAPIAARFYESCSQNEKTFTAVRSVCLVRFLQATKLESKDAESLLSRYPAQVVAIAARLVAKKNN